MARPRATPLAEYLAQEMPILDAADIPILIETIAEWMTDNDMPRGAKNVAMDRVQLRQKLGLD